MRTLDGATAALRPSPFALVNERTLSSIRDLIHVLLTRRELGGQSLVRLTKGVFLHLEPGVHVPG